VVRVFLAGDPAQLRARLGAFGAQGEPLERFLRDLRALVAAAPVEVADAGDPRVAEWVAKAGGSVLRTGSHLLFSVSSTAQAGEWAANAPWAGILRRVAESAAAYSTRAFDVPLPGGRIELGGAPRLMGIVNVTPDSFSDGGAYGSAEEAVARGVAMASEGASILDVGGESTRPGSRPVSPAEELSRVIPVIRGLAGKTDALLSVDTTKACVAREAIAAGARMVNDTSALMDDARMADVVRSAGCAVVLMHRRGTPETMQDAPHYDSLFDELLAELSDRIAVAASAGIERNRILVDPGIGFGKRFGDNLELHRYLDELRVLGRPIVFGPSRKGFLGALTGRPAAERAFGTAAAVTAAVLHGAHVVRVHDVREMREVVQVAEAIRGPLT
jgi:dihydropteroate synthase